MYALLKFDDVKKTQLGDILKMKTLFAAMFGQAGAGYLANIPKCHLCANQAKGLIVQTGN